MTDIGALLLKDGALFEAKSIAADGMVCGELVFNTAQTGYQEILTDPSYTEQLIVFTQPHIGNVGVNLVDMESEKVAVKGAIMRSFSETFSNWRGQESLKNFFTRNNLLALSDLDTRALTQHLRTKGSQTACLIAGETDLNKAENFLKNAINMEGCDLAKTVTTKEVYQLTAKSSARFHIVVIDFGVKRSILNALLERDCRLTVVPANTACEEILSLHPDAILLSNGPGDPAACDYAINTTKKLLQNNFPIMAICLGHQLLALASGANTKKMRFGHHGANHPILELKTGKVAISSQNHGFVVEEESLPTCLRITHRSLFDKSIAGIERIDKPAFGFQGHPEAGPGPSELTNLFDYFITKIECHYAQTTRT